MSTGSEQHIVLKGTTQHPAKKQLCRAAVASVAFVTLHHCGGKAEEFWSGVANDDGLKRGDPRKALLKELLKGEANRLPRHARSIIPATAWNAWHRGDEIAFIRVSTSSRLRIRGTPHYVGKAKAEEGS